MGGSVSEDTSFSSLEGLPPLAIARKLRLQDRAVADERLPRCGAKSAVGSVADLDFPPASFGRSACLIEGVELCFTIGSTDDQKVVILGGDEVSSLNVDVDPFLKSNRSDAWQQVDRCCPAITICLLPAG